MFKKKKIFENIYQEYMYVNSTFVYFFAGQLD